MVGLSVLRVVDNATLVEEEKKAALEKELDERQSDPLFQGLLSYLRECWDAARMAKKPIEDIML